MKFRRRTRVKEEGRDTERGEKGQEIVQGREGYVGEGGGGREENEIWREKFRVRETKQRE